MKAEDESRGLGARTFCPYCQSQQTPVSVAGQLRCAECNSIIDPGDTGDSKSGTESWRITHSRSSSEGHDSGAWKSLFDE